MLFLDTCFSISINELGVKDLITLFAYCFPIICAKKKKKENLMFNELMESFLVIEFVRVSSLQD